MAEAEARMGGPRLNSLKALEEPQETPAGGGFGQFVSG